eukprot:7116217-Prymnesium_polylepis.2
MFFVTLLWFGGFRGPNPSTVAQQKASFERLNAQGDSFVAVVFAGRQLDEMSAVASKDTLGADRRPVSARVRPRVARMCGSTVGR